MHKKILLSLVLLIGLAVFSQPVFADYTYVGRVATSYDENGNGISGAWIVVQPQGLNPPYPGYSTYSDSEGYFDTGPIPEIEEGILYVRVYCYKWPYTFHSQVRYQEDSGLYFIPQ
jgi:hypothetical protein